MENPQTWGKAEHVVNKALNDAYESRVKGLIGLSMVRLITDALREADLLKDEESDKNSV